jgi:hypothetical protein
VVHAIQGVVAYQAWSKDGSFVYFKNFQEDPAVFRIRVRDGVVERIVDLKDLNFTGNTGMWMGMDRPMPRCFFVTRDAGCLRP